MTNWIYTTMIVLGIAAFGALTLLSLPDDTRVVEQPKPTEWPIGAPSGRAYGNVEDRGNHYGIEFPTSNNQGKNTVRIEKSRSKAHLDKWNGEASISIDFGLTGAANYDETTNTISWSNPMVDVLIYGIEPGEGLTYGGLEYELLLKQEPPVSSFTFQIEGHEDFDFWYQGELSQQEIDEGAFRPDNVVGSYAVYHKTKVNHKLGELNYGTGKAYHIYRPKLIDDLGAESWATLSFNELNGEMTVTADPTFLANATYPVIVDPTLGYTGIGATQDALVLTDTTTNRRGTGGSNHASVDGRLDSIHVAFRSNALETVDLKAFLSDEDTVTDSHTEIAGIENTAVSVNNPAAFETFTAASETLTSGGTYVFSATGDPADISANEIRLVYDATGSYNKYLENFASYAAAIESPWTETEQAAQAIRYSFYITYTTAPTWNSSDWAKRVKIEINPDQVASTLTNFPVYVDLSTLPDLTTMNSDCGDIRVVESDETTETAREIVTCNTGAGTGEIFFLADSISSSATTTFYIYYDNDSAFDYGRSETYGSENVWNSNYTAVYHLQEAVNNNDDGYVDSTSNLNHASGTSMALTEVNGKLAGKAQDFDGAADYINTPQLLTDATWSISAWMDIDTLNGSAGTPLYYQEVGGNTLGQEFGLIDNYPSAGTETFFARHGGTTLATGNDVNWTTDTWYHIAGTVNSTAITFYFDGGSGGSGTVDGGTPTTVQGIIGTWYNVADATRYTDGQIDEVRVTDNVYGADWFAAEYTNTNTPSTFYWVGAEEDLQVKDIKIENSTIKVDGGTINI